MNAPTEGMRLIDSLNERYTAERGWVYMTGIQALVRLPIQQRLRDAAAGLNTGGYISGYRGSPLGRYDMELWGAQDLLAQHRVVFRAGVNEDLAATAIWGAQYVGVFPGATVDGVFGIWYGKGPGVDRSGDPFRHANLAGTSVHGGVLALAGDDHGAKSSTVANYSDLNFVAAAIPLLYPSNAQELLDYGLHGIAMSRYSGCWSAMKVVTDVVEGGGSVYVAPDSPSIIIPPERAALPGGVHTRSFDSAIPQEDRLYHHKLHRVLDYVRANRLNQIGGAVQGARIGLVSAGKAWQDVQQAFASLGLDASRLESLGIRTLKMALVWPIEAEVIREFAQGLETIVVVEEKRPLLEDQIRAVLYGSVQAPTIIGKHAGGHFLSPERGEMVFPNAGEINPSLVAMVIAGVLGERAQSRGEACPVALPQMPHAARPGLSTPLRAPSFCSGCPHGRSTKLPDGSRALAGIGCHTMAMFQDPTRTTTVSHMGGEGAMWLGQQPFTTEKHVFANMGDGTYFHSGFLALRQAVAAHVPITYKILHNGFVSMTGGQAIDGELSIAGILGELAAEGVQKIALVSDDPGKWEGVALAPVVKVHHRSELDAVQRDFREFPDVSVILYDQPCATERRRLRKRGKWADPDKRAFINSAVCEGCGDCGTVTGCMSIEPLETGFGRKRKINQSSCNKDFSCTEGFCPSFVTVTGGKLRKSAPAASSQDAVDPRARAIAQGDSVFSKLPEPQIDRPTRAFSLLVAGIGGTGVVTIGQTLAVAAHLEGLYSSNLDVTGLAQKYGAVLSHVKFAPEPAMLHATRVANGECDALIGCDLIVSAGDETIAKLKAGSGGVVCTDMVPTSEFARNPDWNPDADGLAARLAAVFGERGLAMEALRLSASLMGDSITANMFLLGAAWQKGLIPLTHAAIDRAVELNGVAIEQNRRAFLWGRRAAHDLAAVEQIAVGAGPSTAQVIRFDPRKPAALTEMLAERSTFLTDYQDAAYAARYTALVQKVAQAESALGLGDSLARAVARGLFKLMAHKDEWEVARLYARPEFREELARTFEGDFSLRFHVAGGPFGKRDPATGKLIKREVGPWLMTAFRLMAPLRGLRGSMLDPFRNSSERKLAAELLARYEADIAQVLDGLNSHTHANAVKLLSLPDKVRGYGHVREAHAQRMEVERAALLAPADSPRQVIEVRRSATA